MSESRHVINLRGPWQWVEFSEAEDEKPAGFQRFQFPDELSLLAPRSNSDCLLLRRDFGRPSGLTDQHRVELVINQFAGCREVVLNEEHLEFDLEQSGLGRCEITPHIQWRNRLRIVCELPRPASARSLPLHDVRVEIVETH